MYGDNAVSKMSARRGGTSTKAMARKALSDRLEAIVVSARAIGQNTPGLEDKFRNPNPRTDQSLITAGRLFARDAEAFKAQFIARAMPKTFIADLEGLVEAFDQAIREREAERNAHTAARASIEAAVSAGMLAVRQLDAVVVNHLHDDPVTMAVWKRDRRIQYPHRSREVVSQPAAASVASAPAAAPPAPTDN